MGQGVIMVTRKALLNWYAHHPNRTQQTIHLPVSTADTLNLWVRHCLPNILLRLLDQAGLIGDGVFDKSPIDGSNPPRPLPANGAGGDLSAALRVVPRCRGPTTGTSVIFR
jgi:hypothetical protein